MVALFLGDHFEGGVTLSSSEEEFVAVSQAGQEVVNLRELLRALVILRRNPQKYGRITRHVLL
jgi:hypothetical protein